MTNATVLIDYGSGNIRSVAKALEHTAFALGLEKPIVTSNPDVVARANRIVLPGQGAFGDCLAGLLAVDGLKDALSEAVRARGVPFLGICVGMQLLADEGHEHGVHLGLGWIPGQVVPFPKDLPSDVKIPHMGWSVLAAATPHPVTDGLDQRSVYFAHSYHFQASQPADVLLTANHGVSLVSAVARHNILGVQFHPEKSQTVGLGLMKAFQQWQP